MAVELNEGDVIAARLNFLDNNGTRAFNLLHYRLANVGVAGGGLFAGEDFSEIAPDIAQVLYANLAPMWKVASTSAVRFMGTSVWNVWPLPRSAGYHYVHMGETAGDLAGDSLPLQDSPTILKRTAFGARWGLGRLFFVGLPESSQSIGIMNEGGVSDVQNFADRLAQNLVVVKDIYTYTFVPVLHSLSPPPVVAARTTDIVSVDLSDPIIKTQRRRRPGKGM